MRRRTQAEIRALLLDEARTHLKRAKAALKAADGCFTPDALEIVLREARSQQAMAAGVLDRLVQFDARQAGA